MRYFFLSLALLMLFAVRASGDQVESLAGAITADKGNCDKAVAAFGKQGCIVIHSQTRRDEIEAMLAQFGWSPVREKNDVMLDFSKNEVVFFYRFGDVADHFSVKSFTFDVAEKKQPAVLDLLMRYYIYKDRNSEVHGFNFIFVTVPVGGQTPLEVNVATHTPENNNGDQAPPIKGHLEWTGIFSDDHGDVADNLHGVISTKNKTIKQKDDILVSFQLQWVDDAVAKSEHFSPPADSVSVWRVDCSNGYRNHGFEVTTPDGKTHVLKLKEDREWGKNILQLIKITAGHPYDLAAPEMSLKAIGLDTSKPGIYVIRGVYSEVSGAAENKRDDWGGTIMTNAIVVEVK